MLTPTLCGPRIASATFLVCLAMLWGSQPHAAGQTNSILQRNDEPVAEVADANSAAASPENSDETDSVILQHKLQKGEVIRWQIDHQATTETSIQGNMQTSRMRTESVRRWEVEDVFDDGRMKFVQSVEYVSMSNKVSDRPEVSFDSRDGGNVPPQFSRVPATIGVPLAIFTINSQALNDDDIVRESNLPPQDLGLGDIVIPLPEGPVPIGHIWSKDGTLPASGEKGRNLIIQSRQRYCLTKVENGIAYISVKTQILTPNITPRIQVQIMQQMTDGMILFDIEKGRVWQQEFEWNEHVIGFDTPDSRMQYNARYIQKYPQKDAETAAQIAPRANIASSPETSSESIRLRDEKPVIRIQ